MVAYTGQANVRKDTAANWTTNNPTLASGELGYETDTGYLKIGNGSTVWTGLAYWRSIETGSAAPASTPQYDGQIYVDTTADTAYIATGTASSADWDEMLTAASGSTLSATAIAGGDSVPFFDTSDSDNPKQRTVTSIISDMSLTTATNTQTLTNKTLTDPLITHGYNPQSETTYTLVLTDQSKIITMSNASANTLTIPPNSSVAFPIGTVVTIWMLGAGTTTIAGGTGVTLSGNGGSGSAYSADIQTQYNSATVMKIATDQWVITGDIDAVAA